MTSFWRNAVIGLIVSLAIGATISGVLAKPPKRIYGGIDARPRTFTFIVSLSYPQTVAHSCGGAIISRRHILTAAHCLASTNTSDYTVRSGIHNLYDMRATVSNVKSHFIHPDYVPYELGPLQNDIGIILLERDLYLGGVSNKIALPTNPPNYQKLYTVAGWGATESNVSPLQLQISSAISLLSEQWCLIKGGIPQQPEKLCGFKNDSTLCGGDSGSPLISDGKIFGIASASRCIIGAPHTYVSVYHYLGWIKDIMNRTYD